MSHTRMPLFDPFQVPATGPSTGASGANPLSLLGGLGNEAMQSLLPLGQPKDEQRSTPTAALPALSWGELWREHFGGGDDPDPAHFGSSGPGTTAPSSGPASSGANPPDLDAQSARQLAFDLGQAPQFYPNSPLVEQLMKMDPMEAIAQSGLSPDQWFAAYGTLKNRSARSWTQIDQRLGPEAGQALMQTAAHDLVSSHADADGLTTLYTEILPHSPNNPDTSGLQEGIEAGVGKDNVAKLFDPTNAEMAAMYGTNRIRDSVNAMHGLPGQSLLRVGDTWKFAYQDTTPLVESMKDSKNLRSVLLDTCYGAAGGNGSIMRELTDSGLSVMASKPVLYGDAATQITSNAYALIGQGVTPDKAFRTTANQFNKNFATESPWMVRGAQSEWTRHSGRANQGRAVAGEDTAAIRKLFDQDHFFGINPIESYAGSRANMAPIKVADPGAATGAPRPIQVPEDMGTQLAFPGMEPAAPPAATPELDAATPSAAVKAIAPVVDTPATRPGSDAHFSVDADVPTALDLPRVPKFNLLEDGLNGVGLLTGGLEAWGGGADLGAALSGAADARTGTVGGASLISGLADTAQNALSLAGKVPQLAPMLAKSPLLSAFANCKAVGMLSALPSVAGYGYDMLTGAADHQKALSGGEAVQGLASAAASTFGGPWGMVASLGTGLGEGVFNNFVTHDENTPTSLGQMGGMIDYSIDQIGLGGFLRDTAREMAFDSRLTDPSADSSSQEWAAASSSIGRLVLMADHGVHSMFGDANGSMLSQILIPQGQAAATPSAALTGGD